ncbi:hypothetical protein G5714_014559 [Onychostoma macrolepis]|uniref:Uncharacterized protein n=1 Tax=Onychostoma macrolepis TaxID=369639 RepID=A0A7J6CD61_9TELE|nr:hypothetical protein G5714_014559 [Onychostoma macrolepis]
MRARRSLDSAVGQHLKTSSPLARRSSWRSAWDGETTETASQPPKGGLDHLTFVGFIDFLARQGNPPPEEAAAPPVVAEYAAASPEAAERAAAPPVVADNAAVPPEAADDATAPPGLFCVGWGKYPSCSSTQYDSQA